MTKYKTENTLFISDLDGTLLNEQSAVSEETADKLNSLIGSGLNFTIATARTIESVRRIMADVNLKLPVILMNGVLIRSWSSQTYINSEILSDSEYGIIINLLKENGNSAFVYTLADGQMMTHYVSFSNKFMYDFYTERRVKFNKPFRQLRDLSEIISKNHSFGMPIYVVALDTYENLEPVYRKISEIKPISCAFYADNYTAGLWYLEIFSCRASKKHAVEYLRANLPFEKIVCFGDNKNDLPMFSAADECYAVSNAVDELKIKADGIIDSNLNSGVIRFISENII